MLNRVTMMGRLCADPELKQTKTQIAVCSFRIAVDRDYGKAGEQKECDFFDVVAWRSTAEFVCRYFAKGRMIVVDGRGQTRSWTDKNGGKRVNFEVVADNVYFADSKRETGGANVPDDGPSEAASGGSGPYPSYVDSGPYPDHGGTALGDGGGYAPDF